LHKIGLFIFSAVSLYPLFWHPALADGEGCRKLRPPTAEEKAYFSKFSVLRSSLPAAPSGWSLGDANRGQMAPEFDGVPKELCSDSPNYSLGVSVYFQKEHNAADDALLRQAVQTKPDPAKKTQLDELLARQAKIAEQLGAAAVKQDMATVDKLNAQLEPLNAQITRTMDELYAPQTQLVAKLDHDRKASIRIAANTTGSSCYGKPEALRIPGAVAWRCTHEDSYSAGSTSILDPARASLIIGFGRFEVKKEHWIRRTREDKEIQDSSVILTTSLDPKRVMQVQNLIVEIDSDNPQRVASLYEGMKLDGLRKLTH